MKDSRGNIIKQFCDFKIFCLLIYIMGLLFSATFLKTKELIQMLNLELITYVHVCPPDAKLN